MTLAIKSPVTRETGIVYRRRALVVTVTAMSAVMHQKGRSESVIVPWDAVYELGLKLEARLKAAEKAVAKKASGRKAGGR